jgi:hypothetical protein
MIMRHFSMLYPLCSSSSVTPVRFRDRRVVPAENYIMCSKPHAASRANISLVTFQLSDISQVTEQNNSPHKTKLPLDYTQKNWKPRKLYCC